jgi:dipeptidyl aminopeptidase/acylaminoacyl peptidase
MAAFNCAQMMGVPSKLIVFPEENHWILKPQNALYWHRSYFGWLDRWMKPQPEEPEAEETPAE